MPTIVTNPESATSCCGMNLERNVGEAERVVSIIGGASCVLGGLVKGGVSGAALAVLGGGLLFRGLTGHCVAYQAFGVDTSTDDDEQHELAEGEPA